MKYLERANKTNLSKLGLLLVAIFWGSSLTFIKTASEVFNPNFILAIRYSVSALLLTPIFFKRLRNIRKDDLKVGLILGFLLFAIASVQAVAVLFSDPGRVSFISVIYCILVPFLAWIAFKRSPDLYNIIGAIVCFLGVFFISANKIGSAGSNQIIGDGLSFLSAILIACHIVLVSKMTEGEDPIRIAILQYYFAAIFAWIVTFIFEDNSNIVVTTRSIYELIYLTLACTAIALTLQVVCQKNVSATSSSIIMSTESIFGVLIPVSMGIEKLTLASVIGFSLVFLAIIISESKLSFFKRHEFSSEGNFEKTSL